MGKVEKKWDDIVIYSVGFFASGKDIQHEKSRLFNKTLAFKHYVEREQVIELIFSNFENIVEVMYVDELTDAMLLKKTVT